MGGRAGGGAYAGLNRAQKIAVKRALGNEQFQTGNIIGWNKDSAANDLIRHWSEAKSRLSQKLGRSVTDMEVTKDLTRWMVNQKTGDFYNGK